MLLNLGYKKGLQASVVSAPKLKTLGILSEQLSVFGVDLSTRLVFGSTDIQVIVFATVVLAFMGLITCSYVCVYVCGEITYHLHMRMA
jgi:hypothetical protein